MILESIRGNAMNILLVGGSSNLMNRLIQKLKKEGHRVCLLTGSRFKDDSYERVFESYRFPYDSESVRAVFESVLPEVTVFLGAYDSNFQWGEEQKTLTQFTTGLMNSLLSFDVSGKGRFIFLSSEEIYGGDYHNNITEEEEAKPGTAKGMALAQGENLCASFSRMMGKDIIVLRIQHLYGVPERRMDCNESLTWSCLEALRGNDLLANENMRFALLSDSDAVEYIYRMVVCPYHESTVYNLSSSLETNEMEIARWINTAMGDREEAVVVNNAPGRRCVLSNERFMSEFVDSVKGDTEKNIGKIVSFMKAHKGEFLTDMERKPTLWERIRRKMGWFLKAMIPFVENLVCFIPFFWLNNYATGSVYFSRLDVYLLYVLLFAVVHGQHQAIFSALLATLGYFFRQTTERSGFEVVVDYNTYVWVAQLFIVGLAVGYLHDQIRHLKDEATDEQEYLSGQLMDIKSINDSNVRVKDALTTQIINQDDSIGKIYRVTSTLNQLMPEDVLFRAAEMLGELMGSKDVAIYTVSDNTYARLFSSTSEKARRGGNSVRYQECGAMSDALTNHKVYINREMDDRYPMMANAIYSDDNLQVIVMIWSLPWDHMTLGQADYLVVCGYLIQNAVTHSNRYLSSLKEARYVEGVELLKEKAFNALARSFLKARKENLTECTLMEVEIGTESLADAGKNLGKSLRNTDYLGIAGEKSLYVLLSNTAEKDAAVVMERFAQKGYPCRIKEEWVM